MAEEDLDKLMELARALPPNILQAVIQLVSAIVDNIDTNPSSDTESEGA